MDVELIATKEALRALEPTWEALWSEDPAADIFTSFDWFLNWWEYFGHGVGPAALVTHDGGEPVGIPGRGARLHVVVVRDNGKPVAIAPLILLRGWWRRCPARILAPAINSHSWRSGFLLPQASEGMVAAIVEYLGDSTRWDVLVLDGVRRQSGLVPALGEAAARGGLYVSYDPPWPHSYLALDGTWDQYLQRKGRHFRKHLWQAERALERLGAVRVERHNSPETVEGGMLAFMEIDCASWKGTDGESIALQPALGAYYRDLAARFAKKNRCEIWTLRIANEPAAAFLCLRDGQALYTLKTSYKERFGSARHSPSFVLMARIIQEAWQRDLVGIDFVGRLPFAERWTSEKVQLDRLTIFRNHTCATLVRLVDWMINPMARTKRSLRRFFN